MYSQGKEQKHIVEFFKDQQIGHVLDIGANDGKTFSNSLRLIELGWLAVLVEPSPACVAKLNVLHSGNDNVIIAQVAISHTTGKAIFHESGALLVPEIVDKSNVSLVSTLIESEKDRWDSLNMQWNEYSVITKSWADFKKDYPFVYDFISIDAEGMDMEILKQIDLTDVKLLCIEFNSIEAVRLEILEYTAKFGMNSVIYQSGENLLICR